MRFVRCGFSTSIPHRPHRYRRRTGHGRRRSRQVARVESVVAMSYHGIPGFAWRVRVRLPDGIRVDGLHLRDGHMWFADPRVRPV